MQSACCEICLEEFSVVSTHNGEKEKNDGIYCSNQHFICQNDINPYLTENVFPHLHKLRKSKGSIECPVVGCGCVYNLITLYSIMGKNEKLRYLSIVKSICDESPMIPRLRNTFQDILTLHCPTCKRPVDPYPDACSAVMCLNCGNYYCNYCFMAFASGNTEEDRAASHTHSASHHPSEDATKRDAFLPLEVVKVGQLERQQSQLTICVALAMTSKDCATDNRADIALSLILLESELSEMSISIMDIWNRAEAKITGSIPGDQKPSGDYEEDPPPHSTGLANAAVEEPVVLHGVDNSGGAQLANALKQQNPHAVRQILQAYRNDLDVNYVEPQHLYPLASLAILSKQKDVALLLLRRGADPTLMSRQGRSVLFIVIEAGYLDLLTIIFEKHPELDINMIINSEGDNYTMLHTAVRFNQGHIVQYLTERPGINLNLVESEFQYTPIMLAIIKNYKWSIDVLLNAGADISIPARNGRTPLYVAVEKSQISTFRTLLQIQNGDDTRSGINQPVCITHGSRPLHVAALHNKLEMIEFLLASGADIDCEDNHQCTALYRALVHGHGAIAVALLQAGANPYRLSSSGRSYLYTAIEKNLVDVVRVLVCDCHLPINEPTSTENLDSLPITVAIIYQSRDILRLLIELNVNVNQVESINGNNPITSAICLDDYWAVKYLLQHNADPLALVHNGRLPLYVAIEKGNTEIIRLLLSDPRVKINDAVSALGERPLHVAVNWQQADAVSTLLDLGADELTQNNEGKTPLDLAKELSISASFLQIFNYYRHRRKMRS